MTFHFLVKSFTYLSAFLICTSCTQNQKPSQTADPFNLTIFFEEETAIHEQELGEDDF
ncbi:MAG: hypothetical protein WD597_00285 [Balneolaceae bacterium]